MSDLGPNQYLCECCGNAFNKTRTDEAAAAERDRLFPGEETALVCEPCFIEIMTWAGRTDQLRDALGGREKPE